MRGSVRREAGHYSATASKFGAVLRPKEAFQLIQKVVPSGS